MQLCSVSFETGWLQHAFNDAALFYSTLYHWTLLNYDYLPGQLRSPYHLLQLKGSAIRNINSNLTSGEELIDDDIIASVACLASANVSRRPAFEFLLWIFILAVDIWRSKRGSNAFQRI